MIVQEIKTYQNKTYKYTYSDSKKYLLQVETGKLYEDALDELDSSYTYEESNIKIEDNE